MTTGAAPKELLATRTADAQDLDLVVGAVQTVATGVVSVTLHDPAGVKLPAWAPGAHVDIRLGPTLIRQYSLCGDPADREAWRIAVLLERNGRGGSAAMHQLRPGDRLPVQGPRNHFPLEPAARYVFIAGGIGVTPILPMIKAADAAGAQWRLVYGGRTRGSMAFHEELSARHPTRVHTHPQDEAGLIDLTSALAGPREDTLVYCCGPGPLLDAVERACAGWPEGALRMERFVAKKPPADLTRNDLPLEVEFRASGITVSVQPGDSILTAAEDAGLPVLSSCQEGVCGTCETLVLEGQPDHRDSVLSAAERQSGDLMMICRSWATSPRLVLDL